MSIQNLLGAITLVNKVIRILDNYTILLDVGELDGAMVGEKYRIFAEGEQISDPMTGRNLGNYEYVKAVVTLTKVFERFSEAQTIEKEPLSPTSETIKSLKGGIVRTKPLPVDETQVRPIPTNLDLIIRIGDKARFLKG